MFDRREACTHPNPVVGLMGGWEAVMEGEARMGERVDLVEGAVARMGERVDSVAVVRGSEVAGVVRDSEVVVAGN